MSKEIKKWSEMTEEEIINCVDEAINQYTKSSKPVFDNGKLYVAVYTKKRLIKKKIKKMLDNGKTGNLQ